MSPVSELELEFELVLEFSLPIRANSLPFQF
jgi:hypothetical protein